MKPHVLKEVVGRGGSGESLAPKPSESHKLPVSQGNLDVMRRALLGVTTDGTAEAAFAGFPVRVAGKTGTAQMKGKQDYAWFAAFAPAGDPKYAVAMVVEQGGHGGSVTAPAVRQILAQLNGLPPVFVRASTVDLSR
jgi:penicillin-binding protein 2